MEGLFFAMKDALREENDKARPRSLRNNSEQFTFIGMGALSSKWTTYLHLNEPTGAKFDVL
jgi:hypothetical protein